MSALNEVFHWGNGSFYLDPFVFLALYFPLAYFLFVRAGRND